jgi:hypothetical protein
METTTGSTTVWLRALSVRKRYDDMPNSTFYWRLKNGLLPAPEYPFGPGTPYWRLSIIEEFERQAAAKASA